MQDQNHTRTSRAKKKTAGAKQPPRQQKPTKKRSAASAAIDLTVDDEDDLKPAASPDFPPTCSLELVPAKAKKEEGSLNANERDLWTSAYAAKYAAGFHLPTCRKLGVITRTLRAPKTFQLPSEKNKKRKKQGGSEVDPALSLHIKKLSKMPLPSIVQAKKHVVSSCSDDYDENPALLERKAKEWQRPWAAIRDKGPFEPAFDKKTGEISSQDSSSSIISCADLFALMKQRSGRPKLSDVAETPAFAAPYLTTKEKQKDSLIKHDTLSVVKALMDLMRPHKLLYNQPLVVTKAHLIHIATNSESRLFKLHIGVYANRMLFEVMTQELQIVMTAVDKSTYKISQPLVVPPSTKLATTDFQSALYPKVLTHSASDVGHDSDGAIVISDDSSDDEAMEQRQEAATRCNTKTVDAFSIPGLFKLIENTGTYDKDLYENKIEPKLVRTNNEHQGLNLDLMVHQKHGLCWLHNMERLGNLNKLVWERRQFSEGDTYYYSPALGQVRLTLSSKSGSTQRDWNSSWGGGGILADEMGLGKTVEILALVVATLDEVKEKTKLRNEEDEDIHEDDDGDNDVLYFRHTTLIIVPPALLSQWLAEIQKVAPWLTVDTLVHGSGVLERVQKPKNSSSRQKKEDADIVMTTYQAVEDNYKTTTKKRHPHQSRRGTYASNQELVSLADIHFARIVLDEMQEIRSWTTTLSKVVNNLQSDCRWMLSGTPLLDGVTDLRGELCFLGLEPFDAKSDDGFFDFAIANHWKEKSRYGLSVLKMMAELIMLRRSKSMVMRQSGRPLLGLKPFTLTYEPVPQDSSERALYCFLEHLMHSTVPQIPPVTSDDDDDDEQTESQRNRRRRLEQNLQQRNRVAFLKMLRELCTSPTLLNGGLGVPSQLDTFNRWMRDHNRQDQQLQNLTNQANDQGQRNLSCDEAVVFLSQVEDKARTDDDFVTDVRFRGGAGVSNRNRAIDNLEARQKRYMEELTRAKKARKIPLRKWAKGLWLKLLEQVTTGQLFENRDDDFYKNVNPRIRGLWRWRSCMIRASTMVPSSTQRLVRLFRGTPSLPNMLLRGWRPSETFLSECPEGKFFFSDPRALVLTEIPRLVTMPEVCSTVLGCLSEQSLREEPTTADIDVVEFSPTERTDAWTAIVRLKNEEDFKHVLKKVKQVEGIQLVCSEKIASVEEEIAVANTKLDEAIAASRVFPCQTNSQEESKAKKELKRAMLGLRIYSKDKCNSVHVCCEKAASPARTEVPETAESLLASLTEQVEEVTPGLIENRMTIRDKENELKKLDKRMNSGVGVDVSSLTTFEVLQKLKDGETVDCDICLDDLGTGYGSNGLVGLTPCGHLSCRGCMVHTLQNKPVCFQCRKRVTQNQIVVVDPKKTDDEDRFQQRQADAKSAVQQAAEMLDNNHGLLDPQLWEALYLSMPLPSRTSRARHHQYTAIPRQVLGHLRNATAMPVHCTRKEPTDNRNYKLSSKVRALLADLPRDELSVVFTSSKATVQHLVAVFERKSIGCRSLFTGQSEKDSEIAVSDWKSDDYVKVLVVQAGAAACGLTLTAASKMFLMDPFLKHEEEKQAYARLHRYGQTKEVFCKVYYTPVSVESRLLAWRHRSERQNTGVDKEEKTIFAPLRDVAFDDDDDNDEEVESPDDLEMKQTRYLLGLT